MKKKAPKYIFIILITLVDLLASCAPRQELRAVPVGYPQEIEGIYSLKIYTGGGEGTRAFMVLDREGDDYAILPPGDDYRVVRGLTAAQVLSAAGAAAPVLKETNLVLMRKILASDGETVIGYEVSPAFVITKGEPPEIVYELRGEKRVQARFRPVAR